MNGAVSHRFAGWDFAGIDRHLGYVVNWDKTGQLVTVLGTVAASVIALIAVYYSFRAYRTSHRQVEESSKAANREHHHATALSSITTIIAMHKDLVKLARRTSRAERTFNEAKATGANDPPIDVLGDRMHKSQEDLLNEVELLALTVNSTVVDIGFVYDFMGTYLTSVYRKNVGRIRAERMSDPDACRQLELLIDDFEEIRRAKYVVSERAIASLKSELVDPSVIKLIQKWPFVGKDPDSRSRLPAASVVGAGARELNRDEFAREMHRSDISEDKYSILKHTMAKQFEIQEYRPGSHDSGQLADLFRKVHEETGGQYPPTPGSTAKEVLAYVMRDNVCRRWVAVRDHPKKKGRTIVGHVSCVDLKHDNSVEYQLVFDELLRRDRSIVKAEFFMIQQLVVDGSDRDAGGMRMLLRHAVRQLEEVILPQERQELKRRRNGQVPAHADRRQIGLAVVKHRDFDEQIYTGDGEVAIRDEKARSVLEIELNVGDTAKKIEAVVFRFPRDAPRDLRRTGRRARRPRLTTTRARPRPGP